MKHLELAAAVLSALAALAFDPAVAADPAHDHHRHDSRTETLRLDDGRKWATDAPLRQGMGEIRRAVAQDLHAIHENRLGPDGYASLAAKIESRVAGIFAQCKLPAAADAQLHVILAALLSGAGQMAGKSGQGHARDGAIEVIGALGRYHEYFDDPGFEPLVH